MKLQPTRSACSLECRMIWGVLQHACHRIKVRGNGDDSIVVGPTVVVTIFDVMEMNEDDSQSSGLLIFACCRRFQLD